MQSIDGDAAKRYKAVRLDTFQAVEGELISANVETGFVVVQRKDPEGNPTSVDVPLMPHGIAIVARMLVLCAVIGLGLSACATGSGGPPQPTGTQVAANNAIVTASGLDPLTLRDAGFLLVNQTCDQYLVDQSLRSNLFGTATAATTLGGTAAATFMAAGGNPIGAATAGIAGGLAASLLGILQNSPTMPYSAATSEKVREAIAAIEDSDSAIVPANVYQSMMMVEDAWYPCSLPGAAWIAQTAISTAAISTSAPASVVQGFAFNAATATGFHRHRVLVNGR